VAGSYDVTPVRVVPEVELGALLVGERPLASADLEEPFEVLLARRAGREQEQHRRLITGLVLS
jgi:hypothetical protein